jgi:hypothetical protein
MVVSVDEHVRSWFDSQNLFFGIFDKGIHFSERGCLLEDLGDAFSTEVEHPVDFFLTDLFGNVQAFRIVYFAVEVLVILDLTKFEGISEDFKVHFLEFFQLVF